MVWVDYDVCGLIFLTIWIINYLYSGNSEPTELKNSTEQRLGEETTTASRVSVSTDPTKVSNLNIYLFLNTFACLGQM